MCKTPKMPKVVAPPRYAAQKAPQKQVQDAGGRMNQQVMAAQPTILTQPLDQQEEGQKQKKTLLGE